MEEIFKDIPGYEGLYQVSNLGRVKSLHFNQKNEEGIRKPFIASNGYLMVNLYKDRKYKRHRIHRLVAMAFIPNPYGYSQINHKDENKANNVVGNLEWCTHSYNINYGTRNKRAGEKHRKKVYQFNKDGKLIAEYNSAAEIHNKFGYLRSFISRCCTGHKKTAYGYIWRHSKDF